MNVKNQPKNQHILPQMFLTGFTNEDMKIFMYDAVKNKISDPRNPESVAKQKHIYTVIEGEQKNFKIEEKFSEIENHAKALFDKIESNGFIDITEQDVSELIDFIVLLFIRTTRATSIAEEVMDNEDVLSKMRAIDPSGAEKYIQACKKKKGLSYAVSLGEHFKYRHKVLTDNFDLFLLTSEDNSPPFILNDMFSCLEMVSLERHYHGDNIDWSRMKVKKHFPVSNKHCVSFVPKSDPIKLGTPTLNYSRAIITSHDVSIINRLTYQQKERYAYCSSNEELRSYIQT